jgi:hypothetical protein
MESEIERLYQLVQELGSKIEKLESNEVQTNMSLFDLEQKVESLKRMLVPGIEG